MKQISKKHKWNQASFKTLQKKLGSKRCKRDQDDLKTVFNLAAQVPALKEALTWAEQNGIKFFVDRSAKGVRGYYMPTTGVVALAEHCLKAPSVAVGTIVHEIRHAWQDFHGFMPSHEKGFSWYFLQMAMTEADAVACQNKAINEYSKAFKVKDIFVPEHLSKIQFFKNWFTERSDFYQKYASESYDVGFYETARRMEWEYNPRSVRKFPGPGANLSDIRKTERIGAGFISGKNYLTGKLPAHLFSEFVSKKFGASVSVHLKTPNWGIIKERRKMARDMCFEIAGNI